VATNIGSISGTNLAFGPAGVIVYQHVGLANWAALQTTFAPPINSTMGKEPGQHLQPSTADSYAGTPLDFQFPNGNLVRNASLSRNLPGSTFR
jgi:hypothetical protein